jgi:rod shape determining protein RodA
MIGAAPAPYGGPAGRLLRLNWPLLLLTLSVAGVGFLMLYSVAGGAWSPWAGQQALRFGVGFVGMLIVAMIDIRVWRALAPAAYLVSMAMLLAVEFVGVTGKGAQRWIAVGPLQLQPSEMMKVALVMALASYYAWLPPERVSRPLWLLPPIALTLAPVALVLAQPDLGTAILLMAGGGVVIFLAGAHWLYFAVGLAGGVGAVWAVMASKGQSWQILKDYQYRRIETFLDPASDPLGAGYHITQSKIALGSGGVSGRGFMQGTQSRLDFLPEKHTDFIFTALAEEFGFVGAAGLLTLYALILLFCALSAMTNRDRFGALLTGGIAATFFFFFAVNMAMVMGVAPVVGVPLPLVSYGGSAMLVLLFALGLAQSAHADRRAS